MSIQAHKTNNGKPIVESAICSLCEGDAGLRIKSWMLASKNPDYDEKSRETFSGLRCAFCRRKS